MIKNVIVTLAALISFRVPLVFAETQGSLLLRAYVPPTMGMSLKQHQMNSNQLMWVLTTQNNAEHPVDTQKFEVEGTSQQGLEAHISKVVSKERTVQYEIIIDQLKNSARENSADDKPIFFKISAN